MMLRPSGPHLLGSATSIFVTPHRGAHSFRLTSPLTRFPPQAVVRGSPSFKYMMLRPSGPHLRSNLSAVFTAPQPQSSHCSLGAVALLVSVDSLTSFSPAANAPLGHLSVRSPQPNRRIAPLERSHCSFRLTRSPRFRLRRMPHRGTSRFAPRSLNRRDSTLWRSLVSAEFRSVEISATGSRQIFILSLRQS